MPKLWEMKAEYKRVQSALDIREASKYPKRYLPYRRLYSALTTDELTELIQDAERFRWEVLDLSDTGITDLPKAVGNLSNLRILDLSRTKIKTLPDELSQLSNLESLSLRSGSVRTLPDTIGDLSRLQSLYLGYSRIESLPETIGNLSNLQSLYLSVTPIETLPNTLGDLSNLRSLFLSVTNIHVLPEVIGQLTNIKTLWLKSCHLKAIPYSIVKLGLPFVIDNVHRGHCINLTGVILDEGNISLFGQPREVIEEYYRNRITETASECKVIFLGDGAAGKSSLIERIVNNTFAENSLPTDGVKIIRWTELPDKTPLQLNGKPLALRLMDFGGQEIMHAMHRCFLTAHTVYVVVCESRNDSDIDSVARRWVETVQSFAPDCPVIIALNKSDLNIQVTVDETALRKSNSGFLGAIRTSAKMDGDPGVKQLVEYILRAVPSCLSQLTGNRGFLGLKQELERMEENYILPDKFRERCNHYAIKETMRTDLLNWFRDLGVAYPYMVTFREVYVLNPAWLTNGIYRLILRTPPTGFLPHSVIRETLGTGYANDVNPDKTYTSQEMDFILHVMRQFEISLCVTPEYAPDGVEMVPMKMGKNTPKQEKEFPYASSLHLCWEASYLPNTLVHRLMIRRYEDLDIDCVWRTGGWFHRYDGGCELLAVMTDRTLDVYVSGSDARGYMNTYREQILRILGELNITAEEFVYCTINGKTGRIPYAHVIALRKRGRGEIYLGDIDEFTSVDWILRENYIDKPTNTERFTEEGKSVDAEWRISAEIETRDFFISYTKDNEDQAKWIADTLRGNGYTVYFQGYDCTPGKTFPRWMADSLAHSRDFLAVWSRAYEASGYCKDELDAAFVRSHKVKNYRLLLVRVENTSIGNPLFDGIVRVDLLSGDDKTDRAVLLDAVRKLKLMQ